MPLFDVAPAVPVLRMLDAEASLAFWVGYLGFAVDFEHRFEPHLPLYCGIVRGDAHVHLTGHAGDAAPGGGTWIPVADVDSLHAELSARGATPAIQRDAPGGPTIALRDPSGNTVRFCEPSADASDQN